MSKAKPGDNCALRDTHTPCPEGYIQWHTWAEKMVKTHRQEKCPGCGLYKIFTPKTNKRR